MKCEYKLSRYGEIFRSNLFGRSRIVVSVDPEFNKHVLQHEGRQFQANYPKPLRNFIGKFGLLWVHGDLQKKLHGTAVNLQRFERLSVDFMEDIQNLLHITLAKWQAKRDIHLQEECHQVSNISQTAKHSILMSFGNFLDLFVYIIV